MKLTNRTSIKINSKSYHLDSFYVEMVSHKEFGVPYSESMEKTNTLIRSIVGDRSELKVAQIHQLLVLYCLPKKLQNFLANSL